MKALETRTLWIDHGDRPLSGFGRIQALLDHVTETQMSSNWQLM